MPAQHTTSRGGRKPHSLGGLTSGVECQRIDQSALATSAPDVSPAAQLPQVPGRRHGRAPAPGPGADHRHARGAAAGRARGDGVLPAGVRARAEGDECDGFALAPHQHRASPFPPVGGRPAGLWHDVPPTAFVSAPKCLACANEATVAEARRQFDFRHETGRAVCRMCERLPAMADKIHVCWCAPLSALSIRPAFDRPAQMRDGRRLRRRVRLGVATGAASGAGAADEGDAVRPQPAAAAASIASTRTSPSTARRTRTARTSCRIRSSC